MRTNIIIKDKLVSDELEQAWDLYHRAFEPISALAAQQHLMPRPDFDDVAGDPRIGKWLARVADDDHALAGLATFTNDLDAWPLISPAFFERRWPAQYRARTIWYCGFVAVTANARLGAGVYHELIGKLFEHGSKDGGVIALDFCAHNDETRRMGRSIQVGLERKAREAGGALAAIRADVQTFMAYTIV